MNNKVIFLFIVFFYNHLLIGMQLQKPNPKNSQKSWFLYKTIKNDEDDRYISAICFDHSEKLLGIADCHKHVCIRDIESNKKLMSETFDDEINSICFDHYGKQFAVLLYTPKTYLFKINYDAHKNTIRYNLYDSFNHEGTISSIFFDNENNICGIKSKKSTKRIQCVDLVTNKKQISFEYNYWNTIISASQSTKYFATGSGTSQARLFDIEQNKEISTLQLQGSVTAFAFDASETLLAIASNDQMIRIFDIPTCIEIASFSHNRHISTICFGPSGKTLAIGCFNGKILIFKQGK